MDTSDGRAQDKGLNLAVQGEGEGDVVRLTMGKGQIPGRLVDMGWGRRYIICPNN